MDALTSLNSSLSTCSFIESWLVWVELADRDDARIREAVTAAIGLDYGPYEGVAFESGPGFQFFKPKDGSQLGASAATVQMPARVLTFTVAGDEKMLAKAIEAVRHAHSYEEPVILVFTGFASRADYSDDRDNPNRWWNRGYDV
ncbi:MAG: hypothetical protein AAFQ54_15300 [Pseudomonadota bacterium]